MPVQRTDRLNSLLKEVISDVIRRQVRHPDVSPLITVTRVQITKDLHHAKVWVSVIGSEQEKQATLAALTSAAGFIAVNASKKVVLRYFPELTFKIDDSIEKHMRVEEILAAVKKEREAREHHEASASTDEP